MAIQRSCRLRASALLSLLCLGACHAAPAPPQQVPDPHVSMPDSRLYTAALECAARGYAYVVRTGPTSAYCLYVNLGDEPEGVPVRSALSKP